MFKLEAATLGGVFLEVGRAAMRKVVSGVMTFAHQRDDWNVCLPESNSTDSLNVCLPGTGTE